MANTFRGFVNYGCLAAEKRPIFTAGNPAETAAISDPVEYMMPEGWELGENGAGDPVVTAPWGWDYSPNDLLEGKKDPCFAGIDKNGNGFKVKLEWHKL